MQMTSFPNRDRERKGPDGFGGSVNGLGDPNGRELKNPPDILLRIFANLEEATAVQVQLKRQDELSGKLRSGPLISISIIIIIIIIITTTEDSAY
ncbi:hypothetical protein FDENT_13044 [Fusarium denticulatum]|uniref:Uncharacterized protein n=1 Tax=Fusarium denticulatum TaxID=48507 RepID=A0A8H5T718_9HYPO|nr:hypothetical protein FDENT_13044 [Fusarium denticulatum]